MDARENVASLVSSRDSTGSVCPLASNGACPAHLLRRNFAAVGQPDSLRLGLLAEQAAAVALDGGDLGPAADQHQKNEYGDEIEIDELLPAREPAEERTHIRADNPDRDGQIDMHRALAQGAHRPAEEIHAADEEAQGAEGRAEHPKEPGPLVRALHAEVGWQGEKHDVHRQRRAQLDAFHEAAALGLGHRLAGRSREVANACSLRANSAAENSPRTQRSHIVPYCALRLMSRAPGS